MHEQQDSPATYLLGRLLGHKVFAQMALNVAPRLPSCRKCCLRRSSSCCLDRNHQQCRTQRQHCQALLLLVHGVATIGSLLAAAAHQQRDVVPAAGRRHGAGGPQVEPRRSATPTGCQQHCELFSSREQAARHERASRRWASAESGGGAEARVPLAEQVLKSAICAMRNAQPCEKS